MSIKVLVVDDSALIREVLGRMLTRDGDIDVVGTAIDPIDAREKIKTLDPDVVTLDIEMPNMTGLQFLERLMRLRPTPVVAVRTAAAPHGSLIAIGASTGGVEAIRVVLSTMPTDCPPIVIAQHMPPGFTSRFAARLDEVTDLKVVEAEDRMPLESGHAYIAKGDHHLRVERSSGQLKCRLTQDELASGHRPSVDVLFESVAKTVGPMAVGAILTGMGRDGARGLKLMRDAGAYTVGQSQASALVYGMPRVAFEEGAVIEQAPVEGITARLAAALTRIKSAA